MKGKGYKSIAGVCGARPVSLTIHAPVIDSAQAAVVLDVSVNELNHGIHDGLFAFVWDLCAATNRHKCYRILTASVAALQQNNAALNPPGYDAAEASIVPLQPITRGQFLRLVVLGRTQYESFAKAGLFPRWDGISGKNQPVILPEMVRAFLLPRRIL
jgi:hypothetical protein